MLLVNSDSIRDYHYVKELFYLLQGRDEINVLQHFNTLHRQTGHIDNPVELKIDEEPTEKI